MGDRTIFSALEIVYFPVRRPYRLLFNEVGRQKL